MERVQVLIDKLVQQAGQNESAAQLLLTVQLLQSELLQSVQKSASQGSRKVAVIMPANFAVPQQNNTPDIATTPPAPQTEKEATPVAAAIPVEEKSVEGVKEVHTLVMPEEEEVPEPEKEINVQKPAEVPQRDLFGNEVYSLKQPVITMQEEEVKPEMQPVKPEVQHEEPVQSIYAPVPRPEPIPAPAPMPVAPQPEPVPTAINKPPEPEHHPFDAIAETPTLVQYIPPVKETPKEINQLAASQPPSLNDRLKQEKTELAHKLKETPVKDLRKAIGINDKFLFVNDLFRGDEAMYERSIKTINGFHILGEAEYWMNRELKVKLGWNDTKDTVQHFYNLVRRRFS